MKSRKPLLKMSDAYAAHIQADQVYDRRGGPSDVIGGSASPAWTPAHAADEKAMTAAYDTAIKAPITDHADLLAAAKFCVRHRQAVRLPDVLKRIVAYLEIPQSRPKLRIAA